MNQYGVRARRAPISRHEYAYLVANNLTLSIVFEMSVTLVTSFDDFAELCGERLMVEQVVNPETRARGFRRVSRTNALLSRANAKSKYKVRFFVGNGSDETRT